MYSPWRILRLEYRCAVLEITRGQWRGTWPYPAPVFSRPPGASWRWPVGSALTWLARATAATFHLKNNPPSQRP